MAGEQINSPKMVEDESFMYQGAVLTENSENKRILSVKGPKGSTTEAQPVSDPETVNSVKTPAGDRVSNADK